MAGLDQAVSEPVAGPTRLARALHLVPLGFLAATVLVTYAAIGWTLRRGFDWTDEGFVYTMIASNRIATDVPLGFQHLLHPLYLLTGESVLAFRVLRLAGYVLVSLALVLCARIVLRQLGIRIQRSGWVFILLLAQVGTFLAWSYPPRYLGYNELASWGAQLGVALIVLSLAWGASWSPELSARRAQRVPSALWLVWAGLGALTIVLAFAKVTSAVSFLVILVPALLVPNPQLHLWKRAASLVAGAGALLLVLWAGGVPVGPYYQNATALSFDLSAGTDFGHPISGLIANYGSSLLITGRAVLPALLVFALLAASLGHAGLAFGRLGSRWNDAISWLLAGLLLATLATLPKATPWYYLGELVVFIGAAAVIALVALAVGGDTGAGQLAPGELAIGDLATGEPGPGEPGPVEPALGDEGRGRKTRRFFSVAVGAAAVLAAPFICAAGTNNMLTGHFLFSATLWTVVLGIALVLTAQAGARSGSGARGLPAVLGCVVALLGAFAVKADIAHPYHLGPLLSLQTSTSVPELRGILLNKVDASWVDWVSATGDSLRAGGVPATATASAGSLYVFNHSGYASPWVASHQPAAYNSLVTACTKDPPTRLFVLQPGSPQVYAFSLNRLRRDLAKCGITFPGDFRVVARRASAEPERAMVVWQQRAPVR